MKKDWPFNDFLNFGNRPEVWWCQIKPIQKRWLNVNLRFFNLLITISPCIVIMQIKKKNFKPYSHLYTHHHKLFLCWWILIGCTIFLNKIYHWYQVHTISFQTFFVWALLLIVHIWNSSPLQSYLLRLQCTCCTILKTSGGPHGSPLVWACQWPSSQPLSSPQLSHNDSLWA